MYRQARRVELPMSNDHCRRSRKVLMRGTDKCPDANLQARRRRRRELRKEQHARQGRSIVVRGARVGTRHVQVWRLFAMIASVLM